MYACVCIHVLCVHASVCVLKPKVNFLGLICSLYPGGLEMISDVNLLVNNLLCCRLLKALGNVYSPPENYF